MGTFWHRYHNQYREIRKLLRSYHQNLLQYTAYPCGLLDKTFYILISRSDTHIGSDNLNGDFIMIHNLWSMYMDLSLSTFFRFALIFVDDSYSSLFLLNIVVTLFRFTARHFFYFRDYSVLNTFKIKLFETENLNNQDRQIKTH